MKKKLYALISIIIVSMFMFTAYKLYHKEALKVKGNTLINNIAKHENIDREFLSWINDKYGINSLEKVSKKIDDETYTIDSWHEITGKSYYVLTDMYQNKYDGTNAKIIDSKDVSTLSFVGDVSLADNFYIMPKYDERNQGIYGILSKEVVDIMNNSDVMVVNNEFTISNRGEKIPGKLYYFRASPERLSTYHEMGVDLVTLANNHVYDFGKDAFNDLLNSLNDEGIPYIGAGRNIDEAKRPYYFIVNGYKIAFINATRAEKNVLTPGATENESGVFRCYDPEPLISLIEETKEDSDYVITLIHWGREDSHELEDVQIETAKKYIDAGSDIIIGSHAHVLQGIEFYNGKPIVYNLGDFIFNNETKDTGIFQIKITNEGNMTYQFIPARQKDEYTSLLQDNEKQRVIDNLNRWSINTIIDSDGMVKEKAQ